MNIYAYLGGLFKKTIEFINFIFTAIWKIVKVLFINKYIRCSLILLWTIWPIILVLSLAYAALNLMDQIHDLLDTLVQNLIYSFSAFTCLLIFSLTTWYSIRILFLLKNQQMIAEKQDKGSHTTTEKLDKSNYEITKRIIDLKNELTYALPKLPSYSIIDISTLETFTYLSPIILGLIPFFSLFIALSKVSNSFLHIISLALMMLLYIAIVYPIRNYTKNLGNDEKSTLAQKYVDLLPIHKSIIRWLFISIFALIVLATIRYTNIVITSLLGPISIIFLALTMWTVIASYFNYLDYKFQTPFTVIILVVSFLFNNNNHQIRTIERDDYNYTGKNPDDNVPKYFDRWLNVLINERKNINKDKGIIPVYLIASEGGGIRSAYWTAKVLQNLDNENHKFYRHVFAVSGVSGGSVGAAIYTAQHRDHLRNSRFEFDVDSFFENDFLSPLLTAMLIPDMLQKFSPIGFNELDRARYLEDSWESAYTDIKNQKFVEDNTSNQLGTFQAFTTFSQPFMDLWPSNNDSIRYRTPILFLNATLAETGRKGILTPLSINNDSNFKNSIDIQELVYRHIPLKTAASISARFPLVTPPATIQVINEPWKDAGNFVDGGYLDNSGTTTLLSILSSITYDSVLVDKLRKNNVELKIITINNSPESDTNEHPEALRGTYELRAPLQAFFKSWDNSGDSRQYAVREYLRGFSGSLMNNKKADSLTCSSCKVRSFIHLSPYNFNLNRKTGIIPLGWDLSLSAEKRIKEQGRKIRHLVSKKGVYADIFDGIH